MNFDLGEYMGDFGGELLTCALKFFGCLVLCVVIVFLDDYCIYFCCCWIYWLWI